MFEVSMSFVLYIAKIVQTVKINKRLCVTIKELVKRTL